jgi:transposase
MAWQSLITTLPNEPFVPSVLGKSFIFFGSDHGGERGALLYGLIGTCRLNGIDPEAYLRHILSVLPEWPSNKVAELLPWNVVLTDK